MPYEICADLSHTFYIKNVLHNTVDHWISKFCINPRRIRSKISNSDSQTKIISPTSMYNGKADEYNNSEIKYR